MKKQIIILLVMLFIASNATATYVTELSEGWNLVSSPTTIDLEDLTVKMSGETDLEEVNGTKWHDNHAFQGVTVDGTYMYTSEGTTRGDAHLYKYWLSNQTYVRKRNVESNLPGNATQINHLFYKDNKIYAGCNNWWSGQGEYSWVMIFNADDLTYNSNIPLGRIGASEGQTYYNSSWWLVFNNRMHTRRYDSSWNYIATYNLTYDMTGIKGYQGIAWCGDDIFCSIHSGRTPSPCVDRYHWNGSGFEEVYRYKYSDGNLPDDATQGLCYYNDTFYIAQRRHPTSSQDSVAECRLTGGIEYIWQEAIDNNIVCKWVYTWHRPDQYYFSVDRLEMGYGYWLYAYSNCTLKI